nr:putative titan9 [Tanacetum cinerariifolium]
METLYSKLYNKYTILKSKKDSEFEQLNLDQEEKFKSYVSEADVLINFLISEKDKLHEEIGNLREEVASIRDAKDKEQEKYEKILTEENQKNKELLEEIERLHKKGSHSSSSGDLLAIEHVSGSPLSSGRTKTSTNRKRHRNGEKEVEVSPSVGGQHDHTLPGQSVITFDEENIFSGPFSNANQPTCCRQRLDPSANASDSRICMFQELVECLLDLKFSVPTQTDDNIIISAVHESSGYSFSLGWVKNAAGEEELMYRVSSLGTFERVAPEWMRDVMLFNLPTFAML